MAYPGYVYHAYPKMIYNKDWQPLGYKIVKSLEEEQALTKVAVPDPKKVSMPAKSKMKFEMGD